MPVTSYPYAELTFFYWRAYIFVTVLVAVVLAELRYNSLAVICQGVDSKKLEIIFA